MTPMTPTKNRGAWIAIFSLLVILLPFAFWAAAQEEAVEPPPDEPTAEELPEHYRFSPFWTSLEDCRTTILLHNNHTEDPLTVQPVLYLEDGTAIELGVVHLPVLGSASIPVNETIQRLGYKEPRFGGAAFRYRKKYGGALAVETRVVMPEKNLAYSIPSYASMGESYPSKQRKHAIFRLPTRESEIFFALFNSSTEPVRVRAGLELGRGSQEVSTLTLEPKQWKSIRLPRDLPEKTRGRFDLGKAGLVGGVTLGYEGPKGALQATGWIDDAEVGYSSMMSFSAESGLRGQKLYGPQVMLGKQRNLPSPGQSLAVESYLLLKNVTDQRVSTWAEFTYEQNGVVHAAPIQIGDLKPNEIREVDIAKLRKRSVIPRDVTIGSV